MKYKYFDYAAFIYCNDMRRSDKENVWFDTNAETFDKPIEEIPNGVRMWNELIKSEEDGKSPTWIEHIHHGIMGDGNIRVICHKQRLPEIYERMEDGMIQKVELRSLPEFQDKKEIPEYDWGEISFVYKGYRFCFRSGNPCYAEMIEPNGICWQCHYYYKFGAGLKERK